MRQQLPLQASQQQQLILFLAGNEKLFIKCTHRKQCCAGRAAKLVEIVRVVVSTFLGPRLNFRSLFHLCALPLFHTPAVTVYCSKSAYRVDSRIRAIFENPWNSSSSTRQSSSGSCACSTSPQMKNTTRDFVEISGSNAICFNRHRIRCQFSPHLSSQNDTTASQETVAVAARQRN